MRKGRILFIAVAGMVALFAIARFTRIAEPPYHGHSLSKWVAILGEGDHRKETVQRAVEAVNSIGTNATPHLLAWIQFEPKPGLFQSRANPYSDRRHQLSERDRLLDGSGVIRVAISPRMRLDSVIEKVRAIPMGGTDCALPMVWARRNQLRVSAFVTYTDSETWAANIHPVSSRYLESRSNSLHTGVDEI
jgi:hypothetical protein